MESAPGKRWHFGIAAALYMAIVIGGVVAMRRDPSIGASDGLLIAAAAAIPGLYLLFGGAIETLRSEGVERSTLVQSTAAAFFIVMTAALLLGLLEEFARLSLTNSFVLYMVGLLAWGGCTLFFRRRYGH